MIDHLNAEVLVVGHVRRSAEWYRDKLGFKLMEVSDDFAYLKIGDGPGPGLGLVSAKGIAAEVRGVEFSHHGNTPRRGYRAVFVEDADKEFDELRAKGVKFVVMPTTRPDGQRYAFFEDPDGHLWEISHFPKS